MRKWGRLKNMIILFLLLIPCSHFGSTRPQTHQIRRRRNNETWYYFYAPPLGPRGVNFLRKSTPPNLFLVNKHFNRCKTVILKSNSLGFPPKHYSIISYFSLFSFFIGIVKKYNHSW